MRSSSWTLSKDQLVVLSWDLQLLYYLYDWLILLLLIPFMLIVRTLVLLDHAGIPTTVLIRIDLNAFINVFQSSE